MIGGTTTMNDMAVAPVSRQDFYWATDDAHECVKHVVARRDEFFEYLKRSEVYEQIVRNWEYYHGLYYTAPGHSNMAIRQVGELKEKSKISINHFRSFIHLLITYTIQNRPAWDTLASNSETRSLNQAELGNNLLDYYMETQGVEGMMKDLVEMSLIYTISYVKCVWDDSLGREIGADPDLNIYYEGDIKNETYSILDVAYDHTVRDWRDSRWACCRSVENKWELISKYPGLREEILNAAKGDEVKPDPFLDARLTGHNTDNVSVWSFYHERTPAHPMGRYLAFVGDKTPIYDGPMPYRRKPLYRLCSAKWLGTTLGYSPAFDLQGPQEAYNMAASTIVTNHNNLGPTKIWCRSQENINIAELEPGITVLQTDTEPKPLNLLATPAEFFKVLDLWESIMERISGVNSVARGQPEASLKSGAALALIDSKAMQYASTLIQAYYTLLADWGTALLHTLKDHANSRRVIAIAGADHRAQLREFWAHEELDMIDRVIVQSGNPLMRTVAGRKEVASELLQNGLITTPQEYLTVLRTGQTKPLTETIDAQLNKVHSENEALRNGLQAAGGAPVHAAMVTDDHGLHIKKHAAILDSPENYGDPAIAQPVLAAIMEHIAMLQQPAVQILMAIQGFVIPPIPIAGPTGNATGGGENKQKSEQVPGAPPVPNYPVGGDQSLPRAA